MESAEVSAEVHFAQKLASNEKKIRDRAIKRLRKYLFARSSHGGLTESDVIKIWKGLHYCMWMQDKPLLQEELSQKISGLLQSFSSPEGALLFMKVFLETEAREWNGIDKLRLDKFMMMIRDMLHQSFALLSKIGWPMVECRQFAEAVASKVMLPGETRLPDGLRLHLADIYVDELLKVSLDEMSSRKMVLLLRPFIDFLIYTSKTELAARVMQEVITKVLTTVSTVRRHTSAASDGGGASNPRQTEDDEDDEEEEMDDGEIDKDVDVGEEEGMDDDEENETAESPSNFVMDADLLLFLLFKLAKDPQVRAKNRALVYKLVRKYPETYDNIVNTLASSSDACIQAKDDVDGGGGTLKDLTLFHNTGQGGDPLQQQGKKKKRKDKNNSRKEGEECSESSSNANILVESQQHSEPVEHKPRFKNGKEVKVGGQKGETKEAPETKQKQPKKRKRGMDEEGGDCDSNVPQSKSLKLSPKEPGSQLVDSRLSATETPSKKKKKRKSKSSTEQVSPAPPCLSSVLSPNTSGVSLSDHQNQTETLGGEEGDAGLTDENSNSQRTSRRSIQQSVRDFLRSPVEVVIYPKKVTHTPKERKKKTEKKGKSKQRVATVEVAENNHLVATNSESLPLDSQSPSPSASLIQTIFSAMPAIGSKDASKKDSRLSQTSDSPGDCEAEDESSREDLPCDEAETPVARSVFSAIKENYVDPLIKSVSGSLSLDNLRSESSMDWSVGAGNTQPASDDCDDDDDTTVSSERASQTDPGPKRKKAKGRLKGDKGSMTPCGKKKVIFDLRKNRANKFQDYIKSLQRQPESPHLPGKSPSNSILKVRTPSSSGRKKSPQSSPRKSPVRGKKSLRVSSASPARASKKVKAARSRSSVNLD
ncbi:hypothetical protein EGW08_012122 [Elysia chlorotica]|uniref:Uncharacterized protein n=1 Tax=Elysia chlorotica TaxID=188477 RepID=A0A3S0ZJ30_ELYCH|nr:hypothetical protein EGW08_012122 [Elysia chlorotica]